MCERVRERLYALSHSNSEREREAAFGQHGRTPIVKTFAILLQQRGFCRGMRDNAGIGQGVRGVFLGDNIPTVTQASNLQMLCVLGTEAGIVHMCVCVSSYLL